MNTPDFLTHYYEAARGPFHSLTALDSAESEMLLERIRQEGAIFASQRAPDYLSIRRELEAKIRILFIAKGGQPRRLTPHYMILGACPWVESWYQDGREIRAPLHLFDPSTVSLTYGDSFPAMRFPDGKPYRGQVYTLAELPSLLQWYGLPQDWNPDGKSGPERYIEAQVWADEPLYQLGLLT
ncbi:MAG TPA: hypothetical protein VHP83_24885 [Aggregatilineaceae bacterium]|nr:hypothetical protein [Aggregatilineaceae bacterium]